MVERETQLPLDAAQRCSVFVFSLAEIFALKEIGIFIVKIKLLLTYIACLLILSFDKFRKADFTP